MKRDQQRVRTVLADTVTLLCRNGLTFQRELRIQGVIGITIDENDSFIVHINETFDGLSENSLTPEDLSATVIRDVNKSNPDQKKQSTNITSVSTCGENLASHESIDESHNSSTESCKRDRSDSECMQQRPHKVARRSSFSTVGRANKVGSASLDGFTTDTDRNVELRKSTSESGRKDRKRNKIILSSDATSVSINDSCTISSDEDIDEENNDNDGNDDMCDKIENKAKSHIDADLTITRLHKVGIKQEETVGVVALRSPRNCNTTPATVKHKVIDPLFTSSPANNVGDVDNNDADKNEKEFSHKDIERPTPVFNSRTKLPLVKTEGSKNDSIIVRDADDDQSMDRSMEDRRGDYIYQQEGGGNLGDEEEEWDDDKKGVPKLEQDWIDDGVSFPYTDHNESSDVQNWIGSSYRQRHFGLSNSSGQLQSEKSPFNNSTSNSWRRHSWGRSAASVAVGQDYFSSAMSHSGGLRESEGPGYEVMSRFVCSYVGCGTSFSNKQNLQRHQTHKHGRQKMNRHRTMYFDSFGAQ